MFLARSQSPYSKIFLFPVMTPESKPSLPLLDTDVPRDESAPESLVSAIAHSLDLSPGDVPVFDTLPPIGDEDEGSQVTRSSCRPEALDTHLQDHKACPTLAELQAQIGPLSPRLVTNQNASMLGEVEGRNSDSSSDADNLSLPPRRRPATDSSSSYGSISTKTSTDSRTSPPPDTKTQLEHLLLSTSRVERVCLITPRAGPFDGQLTALVTLHDSSSKPYTETITPLIEDLDSHQKHINALRTAVQEWGCDYARPQVWIILQSMAVNEDGKPDARKLQTWVQNINQELYAKIMKVQIPERRRKAVKMPSLQSKFHSRSTSQTSPREDRASRRDWAEPSIPPEEVEFFPLSPMQKLFFRTSMNGESELGPPTETDQRFTQSIMLRIKGEAQLIDVEAALEALVARHEMLRARFRLVNKEWTQVILPQAEHSYRFRHHLDTTEEDVEDVVDQAQTVINPIDGPVFSADYVRVAVDDQRLYLVAHHLVVDLVSWRIMIHDLDELLQKGTLLSEGSLPFPHWVNQQSFESEHKPAEPILPSEPIPVDVEYWGLKDKPNRYEDSEGLSSSLSAELTSLLQSFCRKVFRMEAEDVFMAALLLSFRRAFPDKAAPTIWKRGHGRDNAHPQFNITETVGWFTSICPTTIGLEPSTDLLYVLKLIKDTRRLVPRSGVPFTAPEIPSSQDSADNIPVEVMFNYVDSLQELYRKDGVLEPVTNPERGSYSLKSNVGDAVGRMAVFEVSILVEDSGTRVQFLYNKHSNHQARISAWVQGFEHLMLEAIGRLRFHQPELTLSDVPLLKTSYNGLAKLASGRLTGLGVPSIQDIETMYPVTPTQQEILVSQIQDPESFYVHGIYQFTTFDGNAINTSRLCAAWEKIVAAHPTMRSIFIDGISEEGLFDQVVLNKSSPNMLFIDSKEPEEALAKVPPLRMRLTEPRHRLSVCQTAEKTLVRIDASQVICDVASLHNLVAELCKGYSGVSPSYNQTVHHLYLYHISSIETEYSLQVWKTSLSGARPCLFPRLTTDATPEQQSFALDVTREQLVNFCLKRKVQPFSILQLGWALVLRAFVGMDQVTFGYEFAGRDNQLLPGLSMAIGSFATNLPCSIELSANKSIAECLQALSEATISANQHQNLTMAEIQHALGLRDNLFNTCLSLQDAALVEASNSRDLQPSLVTAACQSECNLSLIAMLSDKLHINLSSRFLSTNQTHNVMNTFERAIKLILESPAYHVSDLDLFTDRDYALLMAQDWEPSQRSGKVSACLHNLVLQHAFTQPDAPAICSWDGHVTYSQLAIYVSKLKTYLVNLGAAPGMTIPVVLEKNRWAPVIMLAVMQAGACFIALDSQDKVTIESALKEIKPHFVLATETAWKDLGMMVLNLVVVNDTFFATMAPQMACMAQDATPDHAACVFISPGKTKTRSIFFTHASLSSVFTAQGPALKLNNRSRVLQLSSFNVDIALVEILGTMVHGGCVCIPSAQERIENLAGAIAKMVVNWSYMTGVLARRINPATVPTLKTLCFRTRKLDEDTYRTWVRERDILLAYGAPDVCPLGISITEIGRNGDLSTISSPLVGRFWILNPRDPHKLAPIGAIGELAIDSPIVTPYKFVPGQSPVVSNMAGSPSEMKSRYLKTGHRVRYLDNGNIQFLSSIRDDVEVDGSKVDVVEVERHIRRCLGRGIDVVVDAITTSEGVRLLAAFLELGDALFFGTEDLHNLDSSVKEQVSAMKQTLEASLATHASKLPPHSMPSVLIPIKHFPISTSLKINRRKLQRMASLFSYSDLTEITAGSGSVPVQQARLSQKPLPLTQLEEEMREIWARMLSVSSSEIDGSSNLSSLGGTKFSATELVVECRKVGLDVSIKDLLNGASLTDICRAMAASDDLDDSPGTMTMSKRFDTNFINDIIAPQVQVSCKDIIDITEASASQVHGLDLAMRTPRADITCVILNFNGVIQRHTLEAACEALTTLHPVLRAAFAVHGRHVYQVLIKSFKPEFERRPCLSAELEALVEETVKQDQNLQFKLTEPVTKFTFLDAGQQGALIVRLSKTQIDETSASLLVQDLIALHEDPDKSRAKSSFFDYMRAAQSVNQNRGVRYWRELLKDAQMTEVVTQNRPRSLASRAETIQQSVKVNSIESYGMAMESVIKAAWAIVLAKLSGNNDVVFGEVVQGHNVYVPESVDIASMIGPLANVIPVRVQFPSIHSTPVDVMQWIQNQRHSNSRYESVGIQDLARKCTKWSFWKPFSTVVQQRTQLVPDGTMTFNLGTTTFTYKSIGPSLQDIPDLLVCWTMEAPERVNLEIQFPEDRVNRGFAEDALRLLVSAVEMLTCYDTITRQMIPSADEIARSAKQIPLPIPVDDDDNNNFQVPMGHLLPQNQRVILQTLINKAWTDILSASSHSIPDADLHQASFWDLWGCLLPAYLLASHFTRDLPSLPINGIDKITITPEDIIAHPTMLSQFELIVRRLRQDGSLSLPARRKTMSFSHGPLVWSPKLGGSSPTQPLNWKLGIRKLRGHESRASMRELGSKASGWMKHRVSASWDSSLSRSVSAMRESPSRNDLSDDPLREMTLRESRDLGSLGGAVGGLCITEEVEAGWVSPGEGGGMRGTLFERSPQGSPVGSR